MLFEVYLVYGQACIPVFNDWSRDFLSLFPQILFGNRNTSGISTNRPTTKLKAILAADKKQTELVKIFNAFGSLKDLKWESLVQVNNFMGPEDVENESIGVYHIL